jgi:hypothetical protein
MVISKRCLRFWVERRSGTHKCEFESRTRQRFFRHSLQHKYENTVKTPREEYSYRRRKPSTHQSGQIYGTNGDSSYWRNFDLERRRTKSIATAGKSILK